MITRRELMASGLKVLFAAGSLHLVWRYASWAGVASPVVSFEREPRENEVIFKEGVFLVGLAEGPAALSATCPHLGCRLDFDREEGRFNCPCHGSQFTLRGERLKGPATKGMRRLSLGRDRRRKALKAFREVS